MRAPQMRKYGAVERYPGARRITLAGNMKGRRIGPVWAQWSPGAGRYWLHNQFFRRDGLESLAEVGVGNDEMIQVHASRWGSSRAFCGIEDVHLRRSKTEWGNEFSRRYFREASRLNSVFRRCPRCLELAPVDTER